MSLKKINGFSCDGAPAPNFDTALHNYFKTSLNGVGHQEDRLQSNFCHQTSVMVMDNSHEITDLQSVSEITETGVSAPFTEVSILF